MPDECTNDLYQSIVNQLESFIQAIITGQEADWIDKFYDYPYAGRPSRSDTLFDIINWQTLRSAQQVFQCEQCGRLFVESKIDKCKLVPFVPDTEEWKDILAKKSNHDSSTD